MNNDLDEEWIDPQVHVQLIGGPYCGEWRQVMRGIDYLNMPPKLEPTWDVNKPFEPNEVVKILTYRHMPVWCGYEKASFMVYNELTTDEALQIVSKYTGWPYVPQQ